MLLLNFSLRILMSFIAIVQMYRNISFELVFYHKPLYVSFRLFLQDGFHEKATNRIKMSILKRRT